MTPSNDRPRRRRRHVPARAAALALATFSLAALALGACATGRAYRTGEKDMKAEKYDHAVLNFSRAVAARPDNTRYKVALSRAKTKAAQDHFVKGQGYVQAKRWDAAVAEFQQVVYLDPSHQYAANELTKAIAEYQRSQARDESDLDALKKKARLSPGRAAPRLNPSSNIPIVLRFKDETIKKIYDALSKASGVNFIYDERLDLNKKISIDLADVTFGQALDTLMTMNKHFFKVWDENTILIAEDNQQKHKEYDDLVIQTFYLSNADVKDVQVLLRTLLDARQLAQNDRLNAITIRDTPARVEVAGKIIEANDKSRSELIVDIELLEINRTLLQNLGIDLFGTGSGGGSGKSIGLSYGGGASVPLNNLDLLKQTGSYLVGPIPGIIINFLKTDADAQVIAKPQVRMSEGEKATVRIGDRIPIPTTTFNAAPTVGGTVGVPITSFTYQNVGINIDIEPRVHHNKEITLKLKVEVSSLAGQVSAGGGLSQPIIGTREIDTTIRLKDNETNLLAGLIREEERRSLSGVPGLSSVPVLRRVFGNTETSVQQTDIVLTLTPHIIRIPDIGEEDLLPLWIGTEGNIALRGASKQSAFGSSPFETDGEEEAPLPSLPEPTVEGAEPPEGTLLPGVPVAPGPGAPSEGPEEGAAPPAGGRADAVPSQTSVTPSPAPAPTGPAVVSLGPASVSTQVGQEFSVSVMIGNAGGVGSVPFHLAFDPAFLEFVNFSNNSPFLSQDGAAVFVLATLGAGGREVIVGLSRQGSRPGMNGSGTLLTLSFRAKQPGTTSLQFTDLSVMNPRADRLPSEQRGGIVVIQPAPAAPEGGGGR
ncbi:MAG: cohesin domain-containing protein [Candidatus Polarisedimenticolia bacterium]